MTQLAMLTGVALIIFVIELQIPNPFPISGVKLGMGVPIYLSFLFVPGSLAGAFTGGVRSLLFLRTTGYQIV